MLKPKAGAMALDSRAAYVATNRENANGAAQSIVKAEDTLWSYRALVV
jgi:hypothetical protein